MVFNPKFSITNEMAKALMEIGALKENIKCLPINITSIKTLRESAKLQSIHYSTYIEGNSLNQNEVKDIILNNKKIFGKQKDENEIKGYYLALEYVENNIKKPITEVLIKNIHALVEGCGRSRVKPSEYRDGQNVIRDSSNGRIVYMPPEAKDVPILMKEFVEYINKNLDIIPAPILAAIVHYQFVTIHPYYDGNGRTARLLTNLILYKKDYDLNGIYSLEEYYAKNLQQYYNAISIGEHHNYYFGRAEADITSWIEFFVFGMLESIRKIKEHMQKQLTSNIEIYDNKILKALTPQERLVLSLFDNTDTITSNDLAKLFNFTQRSARNLAIKLVEKNFLEIGNVSNKNRNFRLNKKFIKNNK